MKDDKRSDVLLVAAFAFVAIVAIAFTLVRIAPPIRAFATIGGVILGPGCLAYRLVTGSRWAECISVGIGINIAILMLLGLLAVSVNLWYPVRFELLVPVTTLLLSIVLYRVSIRTIE
jgi:hypothetical protein